MNIETEQALKRRIKEINLEVERLATLHLVAVADYQQAFNKKSDLEKMIDKLKAEREKIKQDLPDKEAANND